MSLRRRFWETKSSAPIIKQALVPRLTRPMGLFHTHIISTSTPLASPSKTLWEHGAAAFQSRGGERHVVVTNPLSAGGEEEVEGREEKEERKERCGRSRDGKGLRGGRSCSLAMEILPLRVFGTRTSHVASRLRVCRSALCQSADRACRM